MPPVLPVKSEFAASATAAARDGELCTNGTADRLAGLALVALLPAVFWCAVIATLAGIFEIGLPTLLLGTIGAAVAAFLAGVYLMLLSARDTGRMQG